MFREELKNCNDGNREGKGKVKSSLGEQDGRVLGACFWNRRSEVRSPAATTCAAVIVVAQTVSYKLMKSNVTVYHTVFQMRRYSEAPSQSPKWYRLVKLNTFFFLRCRPFGL